MAEVAYKLKSHLTTKEHHLFVGRFKEGGKNCTSSSLSICEEMRASESAGNKFKCKTKSEAIDLCSKFEQDPTIKICGTCISQLNETE